MNTVETTEETQPAVLAERRGRVLTLRLNRPRQMNALSTDILTALGEEVRAGADDDQVRVIAITGSGGSFCAGADLREAGGLLAAGGSGFGDWLRLWRATFDSFEDCSKPVIAVVDGPALAGGIELALACDLILASSRAKLGDVHARFGLVPGGGGSQRLVDAIGTRNARWLMYTGVHLDAERALALGLVQEVFPADGFEEAVQGWLATLAARSQASTAFMKRMSRSRLVTAEGLDREIEEAAAVVAGPDAREGLNAFVEKREPRFA